MPSPDNPVRHVLHARRELPARVRQRGWGYAVSDSRCVCPPEGCIEDADPGCAYCRGLHPALSCPNEVITSSLDKLIPITDEPRPPLTGAEMDEIGW